VTPGTVVVTLSVTNRNGSDTAEATVEVLPQLPVAGFSSSLESASVGETVVFTDASVGATTHRWDFGDGATSIEVSPTHAYTQPGAYTVVLTVANSIGETDTFSLEVRVNNGNSDAGSGASRIRFGRTPRRCRPSAGEWPCSARGAVIVRNRHPPVGAPGLPRGG
jgi:plastocyanin